MKEIEIGKIVNAVGIKGEVKLYSYSDEPMRMAELEHIYLGKNFDKMFIENVRNPKGDTVVVKLRGIDNRNDAETLRGEACFIYESELGELAEDEYYVRDLIGMKVFDVDNDEYVGVLCDVIQNTAQDIYLIKEESGKEILVPAVKEFVKDIQAEEKTVFIHFIEGMRWHED